MRRFNMVLIWALMFALIVTPATARCYVYRSPYYAYAYRSPCRVVYPACPPCYVVYTPCVPQSGWRGATTSPEPRTTNRREVEPKPELSADDTLPMPNPLLDDSFDDAPPEPPVALPTEPGPVDDMPVEDMPEETPIVEEPTLEEPADDFDALFDSEPEAEAPATEEPPLIEETPPAEEPISEPAKSEPDESAPVDTPLSEETNDVLEDLFGSEGESTEKEMPADEQPDPQPVDPFAEEPSAEGPSAGKGAEDAPSADAVEDLFGESSEDAPADEPSSDDDLFGSEDWPAEEATDEYELFAEPGDQPEPDPADNADDELPAEDAPATETPAEEESEGESAEESVEESSEDDDLFGDGLALTSMDGGLSSRLYRTWVDNTGHHTTSGRLVKIIRGKVQILKETGYTTTVPLYRLSRADLAFLHGQILAAQRENLAAQTAQK